MASHAHNETPPQATAEPEDILRQHRLDRLHWCISDPVSAVAVLDENQPLSGHPLATESATNDALTEMLVSIELLDDKENNSLGLADPYSAPQVCVRRDDGGVIMIGDFVAQLHSFLQDNLAAVIEADEEVNGPLPENTKLMYAGCGTPLREDLENEDVQAFFAVELERKEVSEAEE